jgi:hypothetical protein
VADDDMTDDIPSTERDVDRQLRDAGARLRATAPGTVEPSPPPVLPARRRWLLPVTLGTAAAAIVAVVIGVASQREDTIEEVPAAPSTVTDTTSPATTPETTVVSQPTAPTTSGSTPPSTAPSTAPAGDDVAVTDVGWDGDGSACLTVDGVTGCFPGGALTPDTATAFVQPTGGEPWRIDASLDDGEVRAMPTRGESPCGGEVVATHDDAWLTDVACGQGGAALWRVLPGEPGGEVKDEAVQWSTGAFVPLKEWSRGETVRVLAGDIGVGSVEVRCTFVVPRDDGGWSESCVLSSPAHPGTLLAAPGGTTMLVDPNDGRAEIVSGVPLRTNGCDQPVDDFVPSLDQPVMLGWLRCEGDVATGSFASVFVQHGPPDGGLAVWQRGDDGSWALVDSGTGMEPDPAPLPLPSLDVVEVEADAPATGFEDVTEQVREWMDARPDLTIADAIAAGDDVVRTSTIPTLAMVPIPSLTLVEVAYADDSVTGARYAVWTIEPDDDRHPLLVAYRWTLCGRGVTDDGLCV